jgi:hypothetical protein
VQQHQRRALPRPALQAHTPAIRQRNSHRRRHPVHPHKLARRVVHRPSLARAGTGRGSHHHITPRGRDNALARRDPRAKRMPQIMEPQRPQRPQPRLLVAPAPASRACRNSLASRTAAATSTSASCRTTRTTPQGPSSTSRRPARRAGEGRAAARRGSAEFRPPALWPIEIQLTRPP